jgi:hypothetical protein
MCDNNCATGEAKCAAYPGHRASEAICAVQKTAEDLPEQAPKDQCYFIKLFPSG